MVGGGGHGRRRLSVQRRGELLRERLLRTGRLWYSGGGGLGGGLLPLGGARLLVLHLLAQLAQPRELAEQEVRCLQLLLHDREALERGQLAVN